MCWDAYDLELLKQEKKRNSCFSLFIFKMQFLLKYDLFRKKKKKIEWDFIFFRDGGISLVWVF